MDTAKLTKLQQQSDLLVGQVPLGHRRFLLDDIAWDWRCTGIRGPRGVGKTTLMLQRMRLSPAFPASVYLSLDDLHFNSFSLRDTVEAFRRNGTTHFYLDEVHKYPGWSQEIKNLYDFSPDIHLVFTGSSVVELSRQEADLSRRAVMYDLPGLSFREYLKLSQIADFSAVTLDDLLANHRQIALEVNQSLRPVGYFNQYLREGYYPFFLEEPKLVLVRIRQMVNLVLNLDLSLSEGTRIRQVQKIGRLLQFIADTSPFKPNYSTIARALELDRDTIGRYFEHLQQAQLVAQVHADAQSLGGIQRPEKIYLDNTNLAFALSAAQPDPGTLRETFFQNQLRVKHQITCPAKGDFRVDARYTFEVGGPGKTSKQVAGLPDSYLALDDMESGFDRQVPLWLFGFLY